MEHKQNQREAVTKMLLSNNKLDMRDKIYISCFQQYSTVHISASPFVVFCICDRGINVLYF